MTNEQRRRARGGRPVTLNPNLTPKAAKVKPAAMGTAAMPTAAQLALAQDNAMRVWNAQFAKPRAKGTPMSQAGHDQDIRRRHQARQDQRASDASLAKRYMRPV